MTDLTALPIPRCVFSVSCPSVTVLSLVDWFSDWTGSGEGWLWLPVLCLSHQVWSSLHLVSKLYILTTVNCYTDYTSWPQSTVRGWIRVKYRGNNDNHLYKTMCVFRGKGDYHRLGHGSDDHVRRPRQVQGLQGKKVIAIATGSLHCVCCTEDGRELLIYLFSVCFETVFLTSIFTLSRCI